jgi:hypothetical protein
MSLTKKEPKGISVTSHRPYKPHPKPPPTLVDLEASLACRQRTLDFMRKIYDSNSRQVRGAEESVKEMQDAINRMKDESVVPATQLKFEDGEPNLLRRK